MDLRSVLPKGLGGTGSPRLPSLVNALLLRAQFLRRQARILGLRGVRPSFAAGEGWTCRLAGFAGVFALWLAGEEQQEEAIAGEFGLAYFPHPGEDRAGHFPLAAMYAMEEPRYWDMVRDFLHHPGAAGLFQVGSMSMSAALSGTAITLEVSALSAKRVISLDGVGLPDAPGEYVVAPGAVESDVDAYTLAFGFLRVFASVATFCLGEPPVRCSLDSQPGETLAFDAQGRWSSRMEPDVRLLTAALVYGDPAGMAGVAGLACGSGPFFRDEPFMGSHLPAFFSTPGDTGAGSENKPELVLLTGFLGSGKTTFLRRFIEYHLQRGRFVAVIQNEIGEIGLDGKLIDQEYGVVEVDEGCVCCSLAGRLKQGLAAILESYVPDIVVLETSGLANPMNLLDELGEVADMARPGAVIAVADAQALHTCLEETPVAAQQIAAANAVIINKADLLDAPGLARVRETVAALNPKAMVLEACFGAVAFGLLPQADEVARVPGAFGPEARAFSISHFGDVAFATHSQDGYAAHTVRLDAPIARVRLDALLEAGRGAYRIKGVVDVLGEPLPLLVQGVAGEVSIEPVECPSLPARFLTFIGKGLPVR